MTSIASIVLEGPEPALAEEFYAAVFGPDAPVRVRDSKEPTSGFRGFVLSPVVPRPADVDRRREELRTPVRRVRHAVGCGHAGAVRATGSRQGRRRPCGRDWIPPVRHRR
jgi:hypothetical protein